MYFNIQIYSQLQLVLLALKSSIYSLFSTAKPSSSELMLHVFDEEGQIPSTTRHLGDSREVKLQTLTTANPYFATKKQLYGLKSTKEIQ